VIDLEAFSHTSHILSRLKPLELRTSQVGMLFWEQSHKNNFILGVVFVSQTHRHG